MNNYRSVLLQTAYAFEVREDANVGYQVGRVDIQSNANEESANNPDDAKCSFTTASSFFSIDPNTCYITLVAAIDR